MSSRPVIFLFLIFVSATNAWSLTDTVRIQRIVIEGNQRTDVQIIRRELLFATGDQVDTTLFVESARNLRRLFFIGEVDIRHAEEHGEAIVTITVEDLYSRALSPLVSGQLDQLSIGLVGLDYNLCGRGQSLRTTLENRAISGYWLDIDFTEPRLAGTRHSLSSRIGAGAEGHNFSIEVARPFATLADQRAYGLSLGSRQSVQRLYSDGELDQRYSDRINNGRLWITRSFGQHTKIRPSFQLGVSQRRFDASSPFSYAPNDRTRAIPSMGLLIWRPHYIRRRFINDLGPLEDLQAGSWLSLHWGMTHKAWGSDRTFSFYQIQLAPRLQPTTRTFTQMNLYASTRLDGAGIYNLSALASLRTYTRIGSVHSLAMHISWEAIHRSEDAAQFLLGLERGLRGFAPRRLNGNRRLRINIEARPTLIRDPWYVLACAAFLDIGAAWTPDIERPNLEYSPGLGFRLGLPKIYNTPVFRGDIAYGVSVDAWQVSIGLGQYF